MIIDAKIPHREEEMHLRRKGSELME